jgi:hypothetical protein
LLFRIDERFCSPDYNHDDHNIVIDGWVRMAD